MRLILSDIANIKKIPRDDPGGVSGPNAKIAFDLGFQVTSVDRESISHGGDSLVFDILEESIEATSSKSGTEHYPVRGYRVS